MVNPQTPPVLRDQIYWHFHFGDLTLSRQTREERLDRRDRLSGLRWMWASDGAVPENAFLAGRSGSRRFYIGRAHYEGSVTPGKIDTKRKACCIAWGGDEHIKNVYEVLCTPGQFLSVTENNTETLLLASSAGMSEEGEPLFIGRVYHKGEFVYGKVQRSHGVCYIGYEGKELGFKNYEVFVADVPSRLDGPYWLKNVGDKVPELATVGGGTVDKPLYIGRAKYRGSLTPGSVDTTIWRCNIAWGSDEHQKMYYEYLCNCKEGKFVKSQGNHVPIGAIRGGYTEYGEPLFIGRVKVKEGYIVGKVQPSHSVCYIPYRGKEVGHKKYEVLVLTD